MENNEKNEDFEEFKFSNDELISILLYSYGGNKSKTYDLPMSVIAADILSYRLKGAPERADLFLAMKDSISNYWKWGRHPEKWNGDGFNA